MQRSKRSTAGVLPCRSGYKQVGLVFNMPTVEKEIPTSFPETFKKNDAEEWLAAFQNETRRLEEMNKSIILKGARGKKSHNF